MQSADTRDLEAKTFIRDRLYGGEKGNVSRYRELVVGGTGVWRLIKYELITSLCGPMPGAAGVLLRKLFYSRLFGSVGRGLIVGRGVTVRHPQKIHLGDSVVLDDHSVIDARGAGEGEVVIGDKVIIGRHAQLLAKNGHIAIGSGSNIGAASCIVSRGGVSIGRSALIGGECHISGGVFYTEDLDVPIMHQGIYTRGPITIGDGVWLGMKVGVLDGISVGTGCVIGAGAIVTRDVPDYAVAAGVPARVLKYRGSQAGEHEGETPPAEGKAG
jgi:acetyltransferase-like isoleucine patch superfamily enzyme